MHMNFILSKMVRKAHNLCSEAVMYRYISSGEGIKASSMEDERKQMMERLHIWSTDQEVTRAKGEIQQVEHGVQ